MHHLLWTCGAGSRGIAFLPVATCSTNGERLGFVPNESGKYRSEAGHGAAQTPIAEAPLYDSMLWPCSAFRLRGARRGAPPAAPPLPRRRGAAFPVCRRRSHLVWRDWGCRFGASALMHKLRLLLRRAFSHALHLAL